MTNQSGRTQKTSLLVVWHWMRNSVSVGKKSSNIQSYNKSVEIRKLLNWNWMIEQRRLYEICSRLCRLETWIPSRYFTSLILIKEVIWISKSSIDFYKVSTLESQPTKHSIFFSLWINHKMGSLLSRSLRQYLTNGISAILTIRELKWSQIWEKSLNTTNSPSDKSSRILIRINSDH